MGLVCNLIFQPIIRLIQITVAIIEYILVAICRLIQELVSIVKQVLKFLCRNVVRTVCGAVCGVICGICDFFCGFFGCSCGCKNVCKNVCNVVTDVVCAWTYVLETVLDYVTRLVCTYILQAIIRLLHFVEALVTMVLTWVCSLIDIVIRWLLCWTYIAEIPDKLLGDTRPRRFKVAPKIVRNRAGYSDWFVYVNTADAAGTVDQNALLYILSDEGRPLLPVRDELTGAIAYYEVATRGNVITGDLRRRDGREGELVPGRPFLYYPYKVMEIASHLFGDVFATGPIDDGTGADFSANLFTYLANVQAWLAGDGKLASNNYNNWSGKYTNPAASDYFGDLSIPDIGIRVDTDATCSRPTNTFLHLVNGGIEFTPPNTGIAEEMTCGAGQSLTFDETNFLMLNKDVDSSAVTTYFVSNYSASESSVGCNDLLGYTIVTFEGGGSPLFVGMKVLAFEADTNRMMSRIVENLSGTTTDIVRVAETYLHECGHQCGLLHDSDAPDCKDDATLHIAKVMDPGGTVRRAFTRFQWCMVRGTWYVTGSGVMPFTMAPELPDSGSVPTPPVP
jgi:hypothetical protein